MRYLFLVVLSCCTISLTSCSRLFIGPKGDTGQTGVSGGSCSVTKAHGISTITCPDGTSSTVSDSKCTLTTVLASEALPYGGILVDCGDTQSVISNGATGAQGEVGEQGASGTNGTNGTNGQAGQNGLNGLPGTLVTPIQFCTGFTPTYPSVFAESGICINNTIYGVYSSQGGFLAELPPGVYSSLGINTSCVFMIEYNCKVTQQ